MVNGNCYFIRERQRQTAFRCKMQPPFFAHDGRPYLNLPHCRRFEYEHLESTVRYLGIEVDDALEINESIEV